MKIQKTKDGSHTLVSKEFGELYHSSNGSIQEAEHIFMKNGLHNLEKEEISVFEMGFGSGLNAILAYYFAKENNKTINYTTIEAFPVSIETIEQLNYNDFLEKENFDKNFLKLHKTDWNKIVSISDFFSIEKLHQKIEYLDVSKLEKQDIVFYDAFAPNAQANLWEETVLQKMYDLLKPNGFLITYCAKGIFKRTLKSIGFEVVALPGPIGKREITMAKK